MIDTESRPVELLLLIGQHLATILGFLLALLLVSRVLRQHSRPATSIAWFLFMVLAPWVGVPAYLVFGGRKLRDRAGRKPELHASAPMPQAAEVADVADDSARRLVACGLPPPRAGNAMELLTDGTAAYERLLALIDDARHSIHLTTFILADDAVGRSLVAHLAARAREGVAVRVLVDAIGSLCARAWRLRELTRAGGELGVFMPVLPLRRRWSANLRNHRKLAIFDDAIVLTGGMNLAHEYMGPALPEDALERRWIDTSVELRGPAVADFAQLFAQDWQFATGRTVAVGPAPAALGEITLQIAPTGPDVAGEPFYDVLTAAIHNARDRIWIVTPYFVPDEGLLRALALQARVGVDVRLVMPRQSNHRVADLARNRLLRELAQTGVRVFLHPHAMIHAKHIVIDDRVAITGSVNMDARSLYLNYELALFAYGRTAAARDAWWIDRLAAHCEESLPPRPGILGRWAEDLSWLLSPLI
ncbi:MAG TPA: phospholipase D-like domain-containing protein [Gammaproteobacteria bacterium]|nr:phospholipase D-like domain-containing protein [Gammaproteobacteria bacterium]